MLDPTIIRPYYYLLLVEGSLEVKLPTIWTDGKAEAGRVRVREEERRERQKKEDPGPGYYAILRYIKKISSDIIA